jgi:cytochrome c peroxidase
MLFVRHMGRTIQRIQIVGAAILLSALAGCHATDNVFCSGAGCGWNSTDWARVQTLSPLADPPPDPSNRYCNDSNAAALGAALYFDPGFSGNTTLKDSIGRTVSAARTPLGQPANVSCASCHDPAHAGTDVSSVPNTVSIGAGIYDVNGQQTVNAAFYPLLYWNGRSDSLWSQAIAVNESAFSMNGSRIQTYWRIVDRYLDQYKSVFPDYPNTQLTATVTEATTPGGKPGSTPGCQAGSTTEPFGDAFDCLIADDQTVVNRVFVNFGKAIAAYEYTLVSRDAPFDRFVRDGPGSGWISPAAERGAMLFVGKASCIDCHNTPLLSDGRFHDIGVPQAGDHVPTVEDCPPGSATCDCTPGHEAASCAPSGAWAGAKKLVAGKFQRHSSWSDDTSDGGAPCLSTEIAVEPSCGSEPDPTLKGAWRTPSLRDVALTAPYMHDGYYQTLNDVVWHYNMGGVAGAATVFQLPLCGAGDVGGACMDAGAPAPHLAVEIKPLALSDEEVADLVAFLGTLTGAPVPAHDAGAPHDAGGAHDAGGPSDAGPSQ